MFYHQPKRDRSFAHCNPSAPRVPRASAHIMADAEPDVIEAAAAGNGGAFARFDEVVAAHGPRIVDLVVGLVQFCGFAWTWSMTVIALGLLLLEMASTGHWCPNQFEPAAEDHGYRNVSFLFIVITVRGLIDLTRYACCVYASWAFPEDAPATSQQKWKNASRLLFVLIKLADLFVVWDGVHFFLDPPTDDSCAVQYLPYTLLFVRVFIVYTWINTALHVCALAVIGALVLFLLRRVTLRNDAAPPVSAAVIEHATRLVAAPVDVADVDDSDGSESSPSDLTNASASCAICLSRLSTGSVRHLACGHVFHDACIMPHLTRYTASCPVCRQAIATARNLHRTPAAATAVPPSTSGAA